MCYTFAIRTVTGRGSCTYILPIYMFMYVSALVDHVVSASANRTVGRGELEERDGAEGRRE